MNELDLFKGTQNLRELALFAGAGGGVLGGLLLGWRTVCAVERDAYAAQVLAQRQNDRCLEPFPIWSDVRSFDGKAWKGRVDVVSGGFPCQDISAANSSGKGIDGERSGLWSSMARIIGEVRPLYAFVENSPQLVGRGLTRVLSDLAEMGYDARWLIMGARDLGAPHKRDRIWIVATDSRRLPKRRKSKRVARSKVQTKLKNNGVHAEVADTNSDRRQQVEPKDGGTAQGSGIICEDLQCPRVDGDSLWWRAEPELGRVANGVAYRLDRLKAIGNGQVSIVARCAFDTLTEGREVV